MANTNWDEFKPADAVKGGVDQLVAAITHVESGGNTDATSTQGARGSMQIMPDTFKQYARAGEDYSNDGDRRSAAIRKINADFNYYGGDLAKTAAAYIGGRGAVLSNGTIRGDVADKLGTTPVKYAERVLARMNGAKNVNKPAVNWDDFKPSEEDSGTNVNWGDFTLASSDLPAGIKPSEAGGGRGIVNPEGSERSRRISAMDEETDPSNPNYLPITQNAQRALQTDARGGMDATRTKSPGRVLDKDIPAASIKSIAQDVAAGALQIIPTAAKGVGDIARLVTGDRVGKGLSDYAESSMDAARQVVGSDRAAAQKLRFEQDMTDPALNAADVVVGNPGALADQVLPTVGSMALPVGVAAAAGKLATSGRAAQLASVIDEATVLARANKVREAAAIGATVVQNAADTYSTIRDKGGAQDAAYLGAAITAPATYVAGRLTGGGAEGQAAKLLAGQRGAISAIPGAMFKEGAQEVGEEAGQYTGETVGTGGEFNANTAGKRLAVAGTLGAVMGGGVDAAGAVRDFRLPRPDPIAAIGSATSVDEAIAAATAAVQGAPGESVAAAGNIKDLLRSATPAPAANAALPAAVTNPEIEQMTRRIAELENLNARQTPLPAEPIPAPDAVPAPDAAANSPPRADNPQPGPIEQAQPAPDAVNGQAPIAGEVDAVLMTGDKLDKDWHAFADDSGSLKIPRADMPQIKSEHRGAMVNFMNARDISHNQEEVPAASLKPTQMEFSQAKVEKALGFTGPDRSILVSNDNHVLDGHHQWMAKLQAGETVKIIRLGAPIKQLLETIKEFPSVEQANGNTQALPVATLKPNGTLDIQGDPAIITARLSEAGLSGIRTRTGIQVGKSQAAKAQAVFQSNDAPAQVPRAQSATETIAPAAGQSAGPIQFGRNNQPLSEGGKPYKTRLAAADSKKLQPVMRVVAVNGGFALTNKTEKQLAAEVKAARRLRNPQTSARGEPIPAHALIASEGGLHADTRADMNVGGNPRVGNRNLFAGKGKGLSMERATARLIEEGYLSEGAGHSEAMALIKRSLTQPQYNADGIERIAEAEAMTQFDDYLAAEQESPGDPFLLDDADLLEDIGYSQASRADQAAFNALIAAAEAEGIDTESILFDAHDETPNGTTDDFQNNAATRIEQARKLSQQAIERARAEQRRPAAEPESAGDGREVLGAQGAQGAEGPASQVDPATHATAILDAAQVTGKERIDVLKDVKNGDVTPDELLAAYPAKDELSAPSKQDILDQQQRAVAADKAQTKANTEAENKAKADAGRSEFTLTGSDRAADVGSAGGQEGMFARNRSTTGLPVSEVKAVTDKLSAKWQNGPAVQVVASPSDFPIDAPPDARGLIYRGTAYIAASNHRSSNDVARTLAHEAIGHHGLWTILGSEGSLRFSRNLQLAIKSGNVPLNKVAANVRQLYVDENGEFNLSAKQESDEIAAFAVEDAIDTRTGEFKPGYGFVKEVYAKLADWLRDTMGIKVPFTMAELHGMLVASMRGLEAGKRMAGGGRSVAAAGRGKNEAMTNPTDVVGNQGGHSADDSTPGVWAESLPRAGDEVDGRTVRSHIPNRSSIDASIANSEILPGVRAVPLSAFDYQPGKPDKRTLDLAAQIKESGEINPLIVGVDDEGPYIIEGGHRLDALIHLGAKELPALVVIDRDVIPNESPAPAMSRSADDSTPGVLATRQILKSIEQDGDIADYALRVIPGEFKGEINAGDILPSSKQWVDGNETEEAFEGTSAVRIRNQDEKSILEALKNLGALGKNGPNGFYFGDRIALVKGESIGSGEDVGESIIENAEVVGIWRKPSKGLSEIQPNESTTPDSSSAFARGIPTPGPGLFQPNIWNTPEPTSTDRKIYEWQDVRVDLKRIQQAIKKSGQDIEEKFDARLAETLYPKRVAARTDAFLEVEAGSLWQSMALNKITPSELADYLHARGAEERNIQIAKVNPAMPDGGAGTNLQGMLLTNQAARDYLANIPAAKLAALTATARKVDAITAGTRQLLVSEGMETQDTIDAWEGAYKNYVPMFRDEAESAMPPHPQGSGFTVKGSTSKRATGSTKEVTNILAHVLMQREAAITRAEKNRVALSLYGLALSSPNPEFWTTIRPGMSAAQIGTELVAMGVNPMTAEVGMEGVPTIRTVDPVTNKVIDRANPMYKSLPGAITLKLAGEDRVLMLNVKDERGLRLAESLKNLDGLTNLDIAGKFIGKSTRWIAATNTQYNPAFGFANFMKDAWGASIHLTSTELRGKSIKVLAQSPMAIVGIARALISAGQGGKWPSLYRQYLGDGGKVGFKDNFQDVNDRSKSIEKAIARLSRGALNPMRAADVMLHMLNGFNTVLENSIRLSAYSAALDAGISRAYAAKLATELTVDFNRKGRTGRELGPLYAFFNASVQGTSRTIEAIKGPDGGKIIAGGMLLGSLQVLLLAAAGYDDDELKEFEKTSNLVIPTNWSGSGKKTHLKLPYPPGLHILPATGRVLTELALNGGKDYQRRMVDALSTIIGGFNPFGGSPLDRGKGGDIDPVNSVLRVISPTVVDPLLEMVTNKKFNGYEIERKPFNEQGDNRPGYERARENMQRSATGKGYIAASKAINALTGGTAYEAGGMSPTPEKIRYLAQVAGGGVLREIEKAIDSSVKAANGEAVKPGQIPVFGRFYGEVDSDSVEASRYYEAKHKMDKAQSSLKAAEKAGDMKAYTKLLRENPGVQAYGDLQAVQKSISELNKLAVETVDNPAQMKKIDELRAMEMATLNKLLRKMEKREPTLADRLKPGEGATP